MHATAVIGKPTQTSGSILFVYISRIIPKTYNHLLTCAGTREGDREFLAKGVTYMQGVARSH